LLVESYPTGRIVLIMDNVSYHKSAAVLAALSLFEHRLLVIWLPPYCPELNLIERYGKHLKELACVNKLHDSIDDVLASAVFMLTQQNDPSSIFRLSFSKLLRTTTYQYGWAFGCVIIDIKTNSDGKSINTSLSPLVG